MFDLYNRQKQVPKGEDDSVQNQPPLKEADYVFRLVAYKDHSNDKNIKGDEACSHGNVKMDVDDQQVQHTRQPMITAANENTTVDCDNTAKMTSTESSTDASISVNPPLGQIQRTTAVESSVDAISSSNPSCKQSRSLTADESYADANIPTNPSQRQTRRTAAAESRTTTKSSTNSSSGQTRNMAAVPGVETNSPTDQSRLRSQKMGTRTARSSSPEGRSSAEKERPSSRGRRPKMKITAQQASPPATPDALVQESPVVVSSKTSTGIIPKVGDQFRESFNHENFKYSIVLEKKKYKLWCVATAIKVEKKGNNIYTLSLQYNDGVITTATFPGRHIDLLVPTAKNSSSYKTQSDGALVYDSNPGDVTIGDYVECHYQDGGYNNLWFLGRVAYVSSDGRSADIYYFDGDVRILFYIPVHYEQLQFIISQTYLIFVLSVRGGCAITTGQTSTNCKGFVRCQ